MFRLDSGIEQASTTTELDTSTNAPSILAINGFFCGFTVLVVLARIYVRVIMLKTMGMDDYLIAAATICGVGVLICFIGETSHGIGMHLASIKPAELVKMLHWQYFHSLIVTVGISLIKLSVATFLLRLVPGKGYKIFLYCMITFLVAFTCSSAGVSHPYPPPPSKHQRPPTSNSTPDNASDRTSNPHLDTHLVLHTNPCELGCSK